MLSVFATLNNKSTAWEHTFIKENQAGAACMASVYPDSKNRENNTHKYIEWCLFLFPVLKPCVYIILFKNQRHKRNADMVCVFSVCLLFLLRSHHAGPNESKACKHKLQNRPECSSGCCILMLQSADFYSLLLSWLVRDWNLLQNQMDGFSWTS